MPWVRLLETHQGDGWWFRDPALDLGQAHKGSFGASPWQQALSLSWLGGLHAPPAPAGVGFFRGNHGNAFVSEAWPHPLPVSLYSRGRESSFSVPARRRHGAADRAHHQARPASRMGDDRLSGCRNAARAPLCPPASSSQGSQDRPLPSRHPWSLWATCLSILLARNEESCSEEGVQRLQWVWLRGRGGSERGRFTAPCGHG